MTSTTEEVARIAAGLTKAQRDALCDDLLSLRTGVSRIRKQLQAKRLVEVSGRRNALGEQVAHLIRSGEML